MMLSRLFFFFPPAYYDTGQWPRLSQIPSARWQPAWWVPSEFPQSRQAPEHCGRGGAGLNLPVATPGPRGAPGGGLVLACFFKKTGRRED